MCVEFTATLKLKRKAKRKKKNMVKNFYQNALQWIGCCFAFSIFKKWELLDTYFYFPLSCTPSRADLRKKQTKNRQKKHLAGGVATNLREVSVPSISGDVRTFWKEGVIMQIAKMLKDRRLNFSQVCCQTIYTYCKQVKFCIIWDLGERKWPFKFFLFQKCLDGLFVYSQKYFASRLPSNLAFEKKKKSWQ